MTAKKRKTDTQFKKGLLPWNKGKTVILYPSLKRSEETKRKISEALKGHSSWCKGKHHTQQTRAKISAANIGRAGLPRAGELNGMYGRKHSEATKQKISAGLRRSWEQRKKLL